MNISNFSFQVNYYNQNGEVIRVVDVKKVPRAKLRDLLILQQRLLDLFVQHNGSIGDILAEEANFQLIVNVGKMLPVVGSDNEYLDVYAFEEDFVQIGKVFFSESITDTGRLEVGDKGIEPSTISKLHQFNYADQLGKAIEKLNETSKTSKKSSNSKE